MTKTYNVLKFMDWDKAKPADSDYTCEFCGFPDGGLHPRMMGKDPLRLYHSHDEHIAVCQACTPWLLNKEFAHFHA